MTKLSNNTRGALKDVSNRFTDECSKRAVAVKAHKRKAVSGSDLASIKAKPASRYAEKERSSVADKSNASKKESRAGTIESKPSSVAIRTNSKKEPLRAIAQPTKTTLSLKTKPSRSTSYQNSPVHDIDARDSDKPLCVTAYVKEMYEHFRLKEQPIVSYMHDQEHINANMRGILVNWLLEVHLKFECTPETLYLTVNIIDRYLAKEQTTRKELQLVGITALFLASKYEDVWYPELRQCVYVCDKLYTKQDIIDMEQTMLETLEYKITIPTTYKFLIRYLNAAGVSKKIIFLVHYILDESLLSYDLIKHKPSKLAAAAILIGRNAGGRSNWSPTLAAFSGYQEEDIIPVARDMIAAKNALPSGLNYPVKKYNRTSKCKASTIELPTEI